MKGLLKALLAYDPFWRTAVAPLLRLAHRADQARYGIARERLLCNLKGDWTVRAGPFAGLVYPDLWARGSALPAKILGTYERELHPIWREWQDTGDFRSIYDIGCAEGYYAVGLARMFPRAQVVAFDISEEAVAQCRRMAAANGVSARLRCAGACRPQDLLVPELAAGGLVVSDCEGFEHELFTSEVVRHLQGTHVVIELHTHHGLAQSLVERFAQTHSVTIVPALTEYVRVATGRSPYVTGEDPHTRNVAFEETRPDWMSWLVAQARR